MNPEDEKEKTNGDKNGDDLKKVENGDENKPSVNGEKTEYAEMINQRPSSTTMTSLSKAPTEMSGATSFSSAPQPQFGHPSVGLAQQVGGHPVPVRPQDLGGMVISPQLVQNGAAPMTVKPPPALPDQSSEVSVNGVSTPPVAAGPPPPAAIDPATATSQPVAQAPSTLEAKDNEAEDSPDEDEDMEDDVDDDEASD